MPQRPSRLATPCAGVPQRLSASLAFQYPNNGADPGAFPLNGREATYLHRLAAHPTCGASNRLARMVCAGWGAAWHAAAYKPNSSVGQGASPLYGRETTCPSRTPDKYPSFAAGAMVFVSHSERATLQYA